MAIAGHISSNMLEHYSHVRLQARRTTVDVLSMTRPLVDETRVKRGVTTQRNGRLAD